MRDDIVHACSARGIVRNETVVEGGHTTIKMVCSACGKRISDSHELMPRPSAFVPTRSHDWARMDHIASL
jgi:hypothetical protein